VRRDRRDVGGREPDGAVVRVRIAVPGSKVGVGVGEQRPQRRAQRGCASLEPRIRQAQPVHVHAVEPLRPQRRGQFEAPGTSERTPAVGVERRVCGLPVGGHREGDPGTGPVQGLQAPARAERLVVGMGRDDRDAVVPGRLERRRTAFLQRRRPVVHRGDGSGRCRRRR